MTRFWSVIALAGVILALFASLSAIPPADAGIAAPGGLVQPQPLPGPVQKIDVFRNCLQVSQCGLDRYGKRRCGLVWRCQKCSFVRVCRKATGCAWEDRCVWGPYSPPIPQPLPPSSL
ncbi:MAG: hypothetical protein VX871_02800 [Pseudomonadota bacterium]|nr:hypothetical protein [Pseudomonadota bacterium]